MSQPNIELSRTAVASWSCVGSNRHLHSSLAWRVPTALQAALPGIIALLVLLLPESPRWLIAQGRNEEAAAVLAKYHGEDDSKSPVVQTEYLEMQQQISSESGSSDKVWWDYRDLVNTRAARYRLGLVGALSLIPDIPSHSLTVFFPQCAWRSSGSGPATTSSHITCRRCSRRLVFSPPTHDSS